MQQWAIGVDLGGTKIEIAIIDEEGKLLDRSRIATPHTGNPDDIINSITGAITELCTKNAEGTPSIIGIGVPGQINKETGIVTEAPNLDWHNVDLSKKVTEQLKIPVILCNDVKAAAWGEWKCGAGVGCDDLVCIFIGTGVGGGIVQNGKMIPGANNTAGEIGHTIIDINGPVCHCGNKGCFEALAGGWAVKRDAQLAVNNDKNAGRMLLDIAGGDVTAIDGKTVTTAWKKGDALATSIINNLTTAINAGVVSAINFIGPRRVILGGGAIEGMPELVAMVAEKMNYSALQAAIKGVALLPAKLHNDSGVIGAALHALHHKNNTNN